MVSDGTTGSLSTVTGASQQGDRSLQGAHSHASTDSSAIVFLGDHQVGLSDHV